MKDEDIISGIVRKDEKAFMDLVDTYRNMVFGTCYGLLHHTEDAEDVAQEVFIEVYRSIHKFKGNSKLSTWLYRISVNKALNYIRDNKKLLKLKSPIDPVNADNYSKIQPAAGKEVSPDFNIQAQQRASILHYAINSLPENQKIAFVLSKYEELKNKEIAEIMNMSVSAVESLIFRSKQNLQKKLIRWYKENSL